MTSLLRHGATGAVEALDAPPTAPAIDPAVVALREELAAQRSANSKLREDMAEAVATARLEGRKEALVAYRKDDEKGSAALQRGIDDALASWAHALSRLEHLSIHFTKSALEKTFADDGGGTCTSAIIRQVETLRRESIVRVRVSPKDFPDQTRLLQLADQIGGACDVRHDEMLQRGDCHIDLRLGRLELSLTRHWRELAAVLDELVADETPA